MRDPMFVVFLALAVWQSACGGTQTGQDRATPRVTLSPRLIQEGQTVAMRASGLTPNGNVLMHLARPDGTEYPEMQLTADARGELTHTIRIILILLGTYELQVIDLSSKAVVSSRFMVTEGKPPGGFGSSTDGTPVSLTGVWQGTMTRPATQAQMALVTLTGGEAGGVIGTIAYPMLTCGGELWLLGSSADSVQLGEHITYGEERCQGHGLVTARSAKDGALEIERREADYPDGPPASGTLPRRQ